MEAVQLPVRTEDVISLSSESSPRPTRQWILFGVLCGFANCAIYPALIFAGKSMPVELAAMLVALFGPLLAISSIGLMKFLELDRKSFAAEAAPVLNAIAGMLFSVMLLIQLAVDKAARDTVSIWLAIDIAWDVYLGLGTLLFAVAMLRHPRFGRWFAVPGLAIASLLLILNLWTFPTPPANAGLFDIGPFVGGWYLAVTIQIVRSLGWVREKLE